MLSDAIWITRDDRDRQSTQDAARDDDAGARAPLERVLREHANRAPDAPALIGADGAPLTYASLIGHIDHVRAVLGAWGIGPDDRVALLARDGPACAAALVATMCSAAVVPLSARLTVAEIGAYVRAAGIRALIADADALARVGDVGSGVAVIELARVGGVTGAFALAPPDGTVGAVGGTAVPAADGTALILHTSGTTALPKRVALSHARLTDIAATLVSAFSLSDADRCVSPMPLVHVHGIYATLATLAAGGAIAALPAADPETILRWCEAVSPTWYTAVPAVHQALLAALPPPELRRGLEDLRFVRSAASALPAAVRAALERELAPVVEQYGLTECTPATIALPAEYRPGTVGRAAGALVRLRVVDANGEDVVSGTPGEVLVGGSLLVDEYDRDAAETAGAFAGGWFRTGDLGYLDGDGFLFLTGRRKEIINKGGENVAPAEVEAALLGHPDVVEAAAFAVPHPTLGEDVAAAVVLRPDATGDDADLRRFAAASLAAYKLPARILIVDAIPKTASGKYQRARLSELLQVEAGERAHVQPRNALEALLAAAWRDVLGGEPLSVDENVFDRGATSLDAARLAQRVESFTGIALPLDTLLLDATVERLAHTIAARLDDRAAGRDAAEPWPQIVPVLSSGPGIPFFFHHEDPLHHGLYCRALASVLETRRPFYVIAPHGLNGGAIPATIDAMADDLVAQLRVHAPSGPYVLGGFCAGGVIALEMARRLRAAGEEVPLVVALHATTRNAALAPFARRLPAALRDPLLRGTQSALDFARRLRHEGMRRALLSDAERIGRPLNAAERTGLTSWLAHRRANASYLPQRYDGRVLFFAAEDEARGDVTLGWGPYLPNASFASYPGSRTDLVERHLDDVAARIAEHIDRADGVVHTSFI